MVPALIKLEIVFEADDFAVDAGSGEALLDELLHFLLKLALTSANDGGEDHDPVF